MSRLRKTTNDEASDRTVLLLQGGSALGAYQAGALQALDEAGRTPDWVAGIAIGAINAAKQIPEQAGNWASAKKRSSRP